MLVAGVGEGGSWCTVNATARPTPPQPNAHTRVTYARLQITRLEEGALDGCPFLRDVNLSNNMVGVA